jgi:DNA polymerase III epsilon subunit-like protein
LEVWWLGSGPAKCPSRALECHSQPAAAGAGRALDRMTREVFISVDVETSGPIPAEFSMLSIGACLVDDPVRQFECLMKPLNMNADPAAMQVSGLALEKLEKEGSSPIDAMTAFRKWIIEVVRDGEPVMVGFNAPFDWSFVNYYFHRFLGANPFGFAALDIKAFYMGAAKTSWRDTRSSVMRKQLGATGAGNHNALCDAIAQAELFRLAKALGIRQGE